jgi:hypothetical protein
MLHREIYQYDPATRKLVNEGVVSVNDESLAVLRYELETFVCDGQYEKGLAHVLETFNKNIDQAQQPAVWVSGFYGSGKSHLVKMLRALWLDTVFPDGATARGIARLPQPIRDALQELTTQARRHGGLHAASGTLGAGASGSVRLALLRIVFKSAGLPEQYPAARFVLWLKQQKLFDQVKADVERDGYDWHEELDNFYVAEGLHAALVRARPQTFASPEVCAQTLMHIYPLVQDISSDEMIKTLRDAVSRDGRFPLTLVVLDEVQQYIGEDSKRSIEVQEVVEACSKSIGGKLLFIGTGQTAVTGTSNLKKLEGRFTVRVELSDADVDAVIRQVILAKLPAARRPINDVLQKNLGEIARQLAATSLAHRQSDIDVFVQDYPLLPVRRRFWEATLRILDRTGTDSQLRNQLSLVHKVIQTNLDRPLGHVLPADYLYFDAADKLLQARMLPRKVHEKTATWIKGTPDEQLTARACGLIFLINKLAATNREIGMKATVDTLAELLVEDLSRGSGWLRSSLPALLNSCDLLMRVGDEYRIQTEESAAWNDEFLSQRAALANEAHRIEHERDSRIRRSFAELMRRLSLLQGTSRVAREATALFDAQLPNDAAQRLLIWVRDGWSFEEQSVRADARQAGSQSPTVFVYLPKRNADELRHQLIDLKAAQATLEKRGVPTTPEGVEARAAMETTRQSAESRVAELLAALFAAARVFQGGGTELAGADLTAMLQEAAEHALQRLYPQFYHADHNGWPKVYEQAQKGNADALKTLGFSGEAAAHPVCSALFKAVGAGKRGSDLRLQFESAPYGWSRDTVDGGLQVLLVAGLLRAIDERGQSVEPPQLERKQIGKTTFRVESATVTTPQRIQIRKVMQLFGVHSQPNEELQHVPRFLQECAARAAAAGGAAPLPELPDTALLDEIRRAAGNEQLLLIFHRRDELSANRTAWLDQARRIAERLPDWQLVQRLAAQAAGLADAAELLAQLQTFVQQRQLLAEPNPLTPLINGLSQLLRTELNQLKTAWLQQQTAGEQRLAADGQWLRLEAEQRSDLRAAHQLDDPSFARIALESTDAVLTTLERTGLVTLRDRVAALPARYEQALFAAARLLEPQVQPARLPGRTLKSAADVEAWLEESRRSLLEQLAHGPVKV